MRYVRRFILRALLVAIVVAARSLTAQTVDQLELLPPLGDSTTEIVATPESIVETGEVIESTAIEPPWWQPNAWFSSPVWDFGAELGLNGSGGNSQVFSVLVAANGKRETEGNVLEWDLKYGKTQTEGIETQNYGLLNSRWDWKMTPLSFLYNKNTVEYDEFKAFDLRLVLSGGLGHHLIKNETITLTGRLGAGASREFNGPDDNWIPEANAGTDFEYQLSRRQKIKLTSDYYPTWEDFRDYRMVTSAHWEILLDEETNLSLKLGALDRYDSTPNGLLANDINYFATLLWKL